MKVWLEMHVDDVLLVRDPARWAETASLLDAAATRAETSGGRLSLRIRAPFAKGDRGGFLAGLVARGHEVGAHAHARDLLPAVVALRAAGVAPKVMAPGFVQSGVAAAPALAAFASALGAEGLTDRLEATRPAYAGWLPRRLPSGPWMLDVSVSPLAWGVVRELGGRLVPAGGELDWGALDRCARVQAGWRPPEGRVPFFGATFHEHDLCAPGTLGAVPAALDGLARWCERWRPEPSAQAAVGAPAQADRPSPVGARGWCHSRAVALRRRVRLGGPVEAAAPLPGLPPHRVIRAPAARCAVVGVHAGSGGLRERLAFLGLPDDALASCANLWLYARQPAGWPAPGNPAHAEEARLVMEAAAAEGPVILLSWSGGCVAAARGLLALAETSPDLAARVVAFVDVEGPVDRMSLVKPNAVAEWRALDPHDDEAWRGRELIHLFPALAALPSPPRYLRFQGRPDHVHGENLLHAQRAVEAARAAGLRAERVDAPVPLDEAPSRWLDVLRVLVASAAGA